MPQSGSLTLNLLLQKVGQRPQGPFQVLVEETFDHSPPGLTINGSGLANNEDVINALSTPLTQLDDTGLWRTELLTAIPSFENGLAAIRQESLVVTYTLKPGLSWSDGAPLTSADIAFTWRKLTQPSPHQL
ncbi:MAG: hypothetical protein IPN59_12675 [Holophaga sp.]|nr:hypothetical protein [Holophaga sp.]